VQYYFVAYPVWTKYGSKHVIPNKDVPIGDVNDIPLNFGSRLQKRNFGPMNRTVKREQQKFKHCYPCAFVGGLMIPSTKPKSIFNFIKMLISTYYTSSQRNMQLCA